MADRTEARKALPLFLSKAEFDTTIGRVRDNPGARIELTRTATVVWSESRKSQWPGLMFQYKVWLPGEEPRYFIEYVEADDRYQAKLTSPLFEELEKSHLLTVSHRTGSI